ncbi:MAG: helix-turn-helix domain-containing protein, partial [Gordonibacter urolithinfaciens]
MVSRQEQRERRREEILRAALRLFVRKGYAGTKVGDIAEAVGMSTGLMFHYFESKEALYEELIGLGVGGPMAMMDGGAGGDAIAFF